MFDHELVEMEAQQRAQETVAAYERLFKGPDAAQVLADLVDYAPVFRPSQNHAEDGMRRVVLRILRFSGAEEAMRRAIGG